LSIKSEIGVRILRWPNYNYDIVTEDQGNFSSKVLFFNIQLVGCNPIYF